MRHLPRVLAAAAIVGCTTIGPATAAFAGGGNPSGTGQPSVECDEYPSAPGRASGGPGSAFNEDGVAGTHYAGEQPQNSNNEHSVSQYDVACAHQPSHLS